MGAGIDVRRRELPRIRVAKPSENGGDPALRRVTTARDLCLDLLQRVEGGRFVLKVPPPRHFTGGPGRPLFAAGLKGRNHFAFGAESVVLTAGEMAILPGPARHRNEAKDEETHESLAVSLYPQAIDLSFHGAGDPVRLQVATSAAGPLDHYLGQIVEMGRRPEWQAKLGAKGLLLAYLSRLEAALPRPGPRETPPPLEKVRIAEARRIVQEELADPGLGVQALARRLRCAPDYLSHLFRRETGQRLAAYIVGERVEAARELLRHTALNVAEIAFAVGFENPGYFARVFRAHTGAAPAAYRRNLDRSGGKGRLV